MESNSQPIPLGRACRLLIGIRLRRSINTFRVGMSALGRKKKEPKRTGTPKKQKSGWLLPTFFAAIFLFQGWNLSNGVVKRTVAKLGEEGLGPAAGLLLALLSITLILVGIGAANKELSKLDWDMEWLLTLPASVPVLYVMKIAERTVTNFFGWFAAFPFLIALTWHAGLRWSAPLVALGLCLPLLLVIAIIQVLAEAVARNLFPAFVIRNTQAVATIAGILGLFLVMSPALGTGETDYFLWDWLRAAPGLPWLPFSQPAIIASAAGNIGPNTLLRFAAYLGEAGVLTAVCWVALHTVHARGAVAGRGVLRGKRKQGPAKESRVGVLKGIVGKDLRLLMRDRTFLANTLIVPGVIVGMQIAFNPEMLSGISKDATHLAVTAFGFGAYMLLMSTSNILNAEGPALWLLYTLPKRMERLLLRKTFMWAPFACIYTGTVLVYGFANQGFSSELLIGGFYALAGLPIYTLIGGALGIFGTDPTINEAQKRLRIDYLYLFMLLQGLYAYGFYAPTHWSKVPLFVLLCALALAMWQNVGRRIPYLLDPVSEPQPTISLSDGLMAALFFFVLQGLLMMFSIGALDLAYWPAILVSFGGAGLLVTLLALYIFWRRKVASLRASLGLSLGRGASAAILEGMLWSLPALLVAVGYAYLTTHWGWLAEKIESASKASTLYESDTSVVFWLAGLAIVAAPICEEIIFRGMVFKGLRRGFGVGTAVLVSSAVFAVVHPALSFVPVFLMAVCAALAFERSKSLLAPMMVHALYNTVWVIVAAGATA